MLPLLLSMAHAASCEPLDRIGFDAMLLDTQIAADRGDRITHAALVAELEDAIPCLRYAPEPRRWVELLLQLSLARFAEQEDWQGPLTVALSLRPTLDRGVGGAHPIARFEPPAVDAQLAAVSTPFTVHVDGARSKTVPNDGLPHLVQVEDERGHWRSRYTIEPPKAGFFTEPIPSDSPWRGWFGVSLRAGAGYRVQTPSLRQAEGPLFVPRQRALPSQLGGSLRFGFSFAGQVAFLVTADLELAALATPSGTTLFVGAGRPLGAGVTVGGGALVSWLDVEEGCEDTVSTEPTYCARAVPLPMAALAVWHPLRRTAWSLRAGGGRSGLFADGSLALRLGSTRWLLGVSGGGMLGFFRADESARATVGLVRGGLELGWGRPQGM